MAVKPRLYDEILLFPRCNDYWTISPWYTFNTGTGFCPLSGSSTCLICSPVFDRIKISRNQDKCVLSINVRNKSPNNIYVESVLLNDRKLSTFSFVNYIDVQVITIIIIRNLFN